MKVKILAKITSPFFVTVHCHALFTFSTSAMDALAGYSSDGDDAPAAATQPAPPPASVSSSVASFPSLPPRAGLPGFSLPAPKHTGGSAPLTDFKIPPPRNSSAGSSSAAPPAAAPVAKQVVKISLPLPSVSMKELKAEQDDRAKEDTLFASLNRKKEQAGASPVLSFLPAPRNPAPPRIASSPMLVFLVLSVFRSSPQAAACRSTSGGPSTSSSCGYRAHG